MAANIFAAFARPVRSVTDYQDQYDAQDARREDLNTRRQQNAIQAASLRRQTEADAQATTERNAFAELAQRYGSDRKGLIGALESRGLPGLMTQAQAMRKADTEEADKQSQITHRDAQTRGEGVKTKAAEYDFKIKQNATATKDIANLQSIEETRAGIQKRVDSGELSQQQAATLLQSLPQNPAEFPGWQIRILKGLLSAGDRLQAEKLAFTTSNTGGKTVTSGRDQYTGKVVATDSIVNTQSPDNAASNARMAADAAAGRAQSERHFNARMEADRAKDAAPGAGGQKPAGQPTESERTAGFLLQRLRDSQRQLSQATAGAPDAAKPGLLQEGVRLVSEPAANAVTGEARQRVEAAQLDILDAALTLGTGAAYTREQIQGYRKSYFPQIGDKPAAMKEKAERLNNLIRAAETKAGRASADTAPPKPAVQAPPKPSVSNW